MITERNITGEMTIKETKTRMTENPTSMDN